MQEIIRATMWREDRADLARSAERRDAVVYLVDGQEVIYVEAFPTNASRPTHSYPVPEDELPRAYEALMRAKNARLYYENQ